MEHLEHLYDESLYSDVRGLLDATTAIVGSRMKKCRVRNENDERAKKKAIAKRRKRNKNKKTHRKK